LQFLEIHWGQIKKIGKFDDQNTKFEKL